MTSLIVAVTGMPGSGKSTMARRIAEIMEAPLLSMGDVVRREVARRGMEVTVENVEEVATLLRKELGRAAVAVLLARELGGIEGPVVVDGLRSLEEARILSRHGRLCIVAVHASPLTRYRRLMARRRTDDIRGWEDLTLRDSKNLEYGIGNAIAMADYMIVNEGPLEEALEHARRIARMIIDEEGKNCSGGGGPSHGGR